MPLYENAVCPVCHNAFELGDDVVFCPECGTPHHRECYSLAGHCANEGLHKSGYNYYEENKKQNSPVQNEAADKTNNEKAENIFPPVINEIIKNAQAVNNEKIGDNTVGDISATVRTNIPRFVSVFKTLEGKKKRTSWNWGAFIFGSFYFFFRKMYKQGVALLSIAVAIIFASNYAMLQLAPKTSNAFVELSEIYAKGTAEASELNAAINAVNTAGDISKALTISYFTIGIIILIRIIVALFADGIYKNRVKEIIEKTTNLINEGATLNTSPFMSENTANINENQLRQLYLSRQGGTSFFAPLIAFFALQLVMRLISTL